VDKWFLGIALACALLLALASSRWQRLTAPAWALISGAIPGAFGIGVIAFFWARNAATFKPYSNLLHLLSGAFVPVYVGSIAVGVVALIVAWIGDIVTHTIGMGQAAKARAQAAAQAAYRAPAQMYRPPASSGGGGQGYGDWGYQERRPIGSAGGGASGGMVGRAGYPQSTPGRPAPAPRSGPGGPGAPAWQRPAPDAGWQEPRPARAPHSNPNWAQEPAASGQPPAPRPEWMPPDEPRAPYTGPSWAQDPAGSQWQSSPQRNQWSPGPQGGQWSDVPPWGNPPAPPSRSPYGQPEPRGGGSPASGQPPYGARNPHEQDRARDDGGWGSDVDDDPWAPRGR
jgi:hypothetical protein